MPGKHSILHARYSPYIHGVSYIRLNSDHGTIVISWYQMDPDVVPQHKLPPHLYSIRKDQWPERSEGHDVRRFLQGQTEAIKGVCDHAISCDEFSNDPRCFFPGPAALWKIILSIQYQWERIMCTVILDLFWNAGLSDCRQPQAFFEPLIHLASAFSCPVRSTTRSGRIHRGRRAGSDQCHPGLLFKSRPCRHRQSMMVRTSFLRPGRASNLNEFVKVQYFMI